MRSRLGVLSGTAGPYGPVTITSLTYGRSCDRFCSSSARRNGRRTRSTCAEGRLRKETASRRGPACTRDPDA